MAYNKTFSMFANDDYLSDGHYDPVQKTFDLRYIREITVKGVRTNLGEIMDQLWHARSTNNAKYGYKVVISTEQPVRKLNLPNGKQIGDRMKERRATAKK